MNDVFAMCIDLVTACIPYAVAFWVVRKIVSAFLGAAFGGKMRL